MHNKLPISPYLFFAFIWAEILHDLQQSCFTAKMQQYSLTTI